MSKTASCRNGYCESGFADKRIHADAVDFWHVAISDDGLPTGCGQMLTPLAVACHRVSRGSNFGQLVSGFNSGRSAGRSGWNSEPRSQRPLKRSQNRIASTCHVNS